MKYSGGYSYSILKVSTWKKHCLPINPKLPSFPGGSDGKASAYNVGDLGLIPGLGSSPGGGHGNPLPYFCLENPHGQRCLAGYSPWGSQRIGHNWVTKHSTWGWKVSVTWLVSVSPLCSTLLHMCHGGVSVAITYVLANARTYVFGKYNPFPGPDI